MGPECECPTAEVQSREALSREFHSAWAPIAIVQRPNGAQSTPHIKSAVWQVEERARFMKEVGDDTLSHVKSFVGGVLDSVHEDVALLGVSVKVHEQQHLLVRSKKRRT